MPFLFHADFFRCTSIDIWAKYPDSLLHSKGFLAKLSSNRFNYSTNNENTFFHRWLSSFTIPTDPFNASNSFQGSRVKIFVAMLVESSSPVFKDASYVNCSFGTATRSPIYCLHFYTILNKLLFNFNFFTATFPSYLACSLSYIFFTFSHCRVAQSGLSPSKGKKNCQGLSDRFKTNLWIASSFQYIHSI